MFEINRKTPKIKKKIAACFKQADLNKTLSEVTSTI